mmetsp:Transcript_34955/g.87511  ORF Transcript_34955/g.87511 Transcript_34955/m.87511 type:complete len:221 (-) Transcript_34955:221-883(-)
MLNVLGPVRATAMPEGAMVPVSVPAVDDDAAILSCSVMPLQTVAAAAAMSAAVVDSSKNATRTCPPAAPVGATVTASPKSSTNGITRRALRVAFASDSVIVGLGGTKSYANVNSARALTFPAKSATAPAATTAMAFPWPSPGEGSPGKNPTANRFLLVTILRSDGDAPATSARRPDTSPAASSAASVSSDSISTLTGTPGVFAITPTDPPPANRIVSLGF